METKRIPARIGVSKMLKLSRWITYEIVSIVYMSGFSLMLMIRPRAGSVYVLSESIAWSYAVAIAFMFGTFGVWYSIRFRKYDLITGQFIFRIVLFTVSISPVLFYTAATGFLFGVVRKFGGPTTPLTSPWTSFFLFLYMFGFALYDMRCSFDTLEKHYG